MEEKKTTGTKTKKIANTEIKKDAAADTKKEGRPIPSGFPVWSALRRRNHASFS